MVICLTGPTAIGKSQIAIDLAALLPCDIISVDSVMVYRGMDIGTSKPDPQTLARVPHHLVDIKDPTENYSVGHFFTDVQQAIERSLRQKRIPLLVGGTMLYFNALRKGLVDLPNYRSHKDYNNVQRDLSSLHISELYNQLEQCDFNTAKRVHQHDRQRIERALLVYNLSKKPLSELCQSHQRYLPYKMLWLSIQTKDRQQLKDNIAIRFKQMLALGFLDEASALYNKLKYFKHLPAYRAVGYRQAFDYLSGNIDFDTFEKSSITATCQLAKRQLTWLRSWPELTQFDVHSNHLTTSIKQYIESTISSTIL